MDETITSFKGFDAQFRCRDFQYAVGQTYTHDGEVAACSSGFHACEYPLDVLRYYAPAGSRFAIVEQSGQLTRKGVDSKVASSRITIKAEISLGALIKAAVEYTFARAKPVDKTTPAFSDEERGLASATGTCGAASATGYQGAASATGACGAASATGYQGAASATGDQGAASATGTCGAASATGYRGAASATGYQGAASATGACGAASGLGEHSVALASGHEGVARARAGAAIVLVNRHPETDAIRHIRAGVAGRDVEPDTWYRLGAEGQFIKVSAPAHLAV